MLPVITEPKKLANADINIWPSIPMFTTPVRSPMIPTIAAKTKGTAYPHPKTKTEVVLISSKK